VSITAVQQAIVTTLKTGLTDLKTCDIHGGSFDVQELLRVSVRAPGVLVTVLDATVDGGAFPPAAQVTFAAFIYAADKPGMPRGQAALALAEAALALIYGADWGISDVQTTPSQIQARNLFSTQLDKKGVAIWGISWQQKIELSQMVDATQLNDFITFDAHYDVDTTQTDNPVAEDHVTLPAAPEEP
jgi:hypothetical protein